MANSEESFNSNTKLSSGGPNHVTLLKANVEASELPGNVESPLEDFPASRTFPDVDHQSCASSPDSSEVVVKLKYSKQN